MTNYFALLNFPRAPWLDADAVNARFLELSAPWHPDRVHGQSAANLAEANQKFADLNRAAAALRDPRERLQHLILLETGAPPAAAQNIPGNLIELFARVGQTCRDADQFLAERARATSPMIQAQLFAQSLDWSDRIAALQTAVTDLKSTAEHELKTISENWPAHKPIDRLASLAHHFATTARWEAQLRERFSALAAL
jgi:DnaJ-domain-containing protein 1